MTCNIKKKIQSIKDIFSSLAKSQNNQIDVISDEIISGTNRSVQKDQDFTGNNYRTLKRLSSVLDCYDDIKIIFGIRRQDNMIFSRFCHSKQLRGDHYVSGSIESYINAILEEKTAGVFPQIDYKSYADSIKEILASTKCKLWCLRSFNQDHMIFTLN